MGKCFAFNFQTPHTGASRDSGSSRRHAKARRGGGEGELHHVLLVLVEHRRCGPHRSLGPVVFALHRLDLRRVGIHLLVEDMSGQGERALLEHLCISEKSLGLEVRHEGCEACVALGMKSLDALLDLREVGHGTLKGGEGCCDLFVVCAEGGHDAVCFGVLLFRVLARLFMAL